MSVDVSIPADHVHRLAVCDPSALDRRDVAAGLDLRDTLLRTIDDDNVKAIVLAGLAGGASGVVPLEDASAESRAIYTATRGLHQVIAYSKKIVIVEVDGDCGPTASAICLAADFVVASSTSTFASPFAVAEVNMPLAVLTMRANRTKAWALRGGPLTSEQAAEAGFVNDVVPPSQIREATVDLARRVALMPLDGITISKMNIGAAFDVIGVGREFDAVEAGAR